MMGIINHTFTAQLPCLTLPNLPRRVRTILLLMPLRNNGIEQFLYQSWGLSFSFVAERFMAMKGCSGTYYTTVIVDTERDVIIGAATLIVEKKFIHDCAQVMVFLG